MDKEETIARVLEQARRVSGRYETGNEGEEAKLIATMYDIGVLNLLPGFELRMWHNLYVCMRMTYGHLIDIHYRRRTNTWSCQVKFPIRDIITEASLPIHALEDARREAERKGYEVTSRIDDINKNLYELTAQAIGAIKPETNDG